MRFTAGVIALALVLSSGVADASSSYTDADVLALELSGELVAPAPLVAAIDADLAVIRTTFPWLDDVSVFPDWYPGRIIVTLTEAGWTDYQNGTFDALDSMNATYGPVTIEEHPSWYGLVLDFTTAYHPGVLSSMYAQIEGVAHAEPVLIRGDGNDIFTSQQGEYTLKRGTGDCLSGCTYEYFYVIVVTNGSAEMTDSYGDPVAAAGPSATVVSLDQNIPNPFNPTTTITFHLDEPSRARLSVYDAAGRLVRNLVDGTVPAGEYRARWNGTDARGRRVASGVYFYRLEAAGMALSRRMVLLK